MKSIDQGLDIISQHIAMNADCNDSISFVVLT